MKIEKKLETETQEKIELKDDLSQMLKAFTSQQKLLVEYTAIGVQVVQAWLEAWKYSWMERRRLLAVMGDQSILWASCSGYISTCDTLKYWHFIWETRWGGAKGLAFNKFCLTVPILCSDYWWNHHCNEACSMSRVGPDILWFDNMPTVPLFGYHHSFDSRMR